MKRIIGLIVILNLLFLPSVLRAEEEDQEISAGLEKPKSSGVTIVSSKPKAASIPKKPEVKTPQAKQSKLFKPMSTKLKSDEQALPETGGAPTGEPGTAEPGTSLMPPGLAKKESFPKGLAKKEKTPSGWNKGKKLGWSKDKDKESPGEEESLFERSKAHSKGKSKEKKESSLGKLFDKGHKDKK